jgi:hypothetical protein
MGAKPVYNSRSSETYNYGELPYKKTHIKPLNFGIFVGVLSAFYIATSISDGNNLERANKIQDTGRRQICNVC